MQTSDLTQVLYREFCKLFKNTHFYRTLLVAASEHTNFFTCFAFDDGIKGIVGLYSHILVPLPWHVDVSSHHATAFKELFMFYDKRNIIKIFVCYCIDVSIVFQKLSLYMTFFHFSLWSSRPSQLPAEILHVYFFAYDLSIVIRNGKIVWKHGTYSLFFRSNLEYPGWPYREYIRKAKNSGFCENCLVKKTLRLF